MEPEESDEALAVRAARGNEEAFSELVQRYSASLYRFVRRYHPDRDDCDDLFQETWVGVLSGLPRFDASRRFSTWLFQIALNRCRDWARRGRTRAAFLAMEERVERRDAAGSAMENRAEAAIVGRAIGELPAVQKEVLLLRYYNGLSEAEVSEILDCPRGTVKSRLHHALAGLKLKLDPGRTQS